MGTSSSFGGSKTGLVPSWVDDPPAAPAVTPSEGIPENGNVGSDAPVENPQGPSPYPPLSQPLTQSGLRKPRGNITRALRTMDGRAIRRGIGQYVAARGGGRSSAKLMSNSRTTATRVAKLAQKFVERGAVEALRDFQLESLAGASAIEVFTSLTDSLCPPGGTIDEAIARDAVLETIAALAADGVGSFDELTAIQLQEFFIGVVSRSIEGKLMNEIGTNSVKLPADLESVERMQHMIHDFVDGCVRDQFAGDNPGVVNINSRQVDGFVSDLYGRVFDLLRSMGENS